MISRRRSKREAAVVGPEEKRYSDPGMDPRKTDPFPDRPCPLCGATERQTRHRAPTPERPDLDVVRCAGCGLLFAHPLPDRSSILARYDDGYFHCGTPLAGGYEDYARDEPLIRRTFARRWTDFQALGAEPPVRRVLDVGCATGVFLDFMREKGWEAEGLEIAPGPRRAAENRGFRVHDRELTAAGLEAGRFGWITAWDVIEHLPDPGAALRECHRLLAPGGLLTLSTPDASAPLARCLGRRWLGYRCVGEHLYFFGRNTLAEWLRRTGFEVLAFSSVGKYLALDRLATRLAFYTRIFRPLAGLKKRAGGFPVFYINSGDTMSVVARKVG